MKVKTRIAIGMILLFLIIIVGGLLLLNFQQNISVAANYHDKMSIPATNLVSNASEMFESTHSSAFEYVAGNQKAKQNYFKEKSVLIAVVDEYENLIFEKGSDGKDLAPLMMQQSMQDFVRQKMESIDRSDSLTQELFSLYESEASKDQIQKQFNSINTENKIFHEISKKNFQMELNGKNLQEKIINQNITSSIISLIVSLILSGIVIGLLNLSISRNITGPLIRLEGITKKISEGKTGLQIPVKGDYEISQLAKEFNEMSKYLEKYHKEGIRRALAEKHSEDLEKINTQKDEFVAMISHELKNPLTPIKLYSAALKRPKILGELNKDQAEAVDSIIFNTLRLERMISDLLDIQKLELGQIKFENKWIKVEKFMAMVTTNLKTQTEQKGCQLINHTKGEIIMKSDTQRLAQVFSNLINNSIDFIPKNKGKIEINAQKKKDEVLFSVKDNGIGMTLETQKNLFQKFYQADSSIRRKHGGTGLGLPICQGIVEGLGGKIWFESEVGKGTNAYFTIPTGESQ